MPIAVTCTECKKTFRLRDEMGGRKVRCPECETVLVVPAAPSEGVAFELDSEDGAGKLHPTLDRDRFLLRQKVIAISEKYVVWDDEERPILYIERPAHFWRNVLGALAVACFLIISIGLSIFIGSVLARSVQPEWIAVVVSVILILATLVAAVVLTIKLSPKRHISFFTDESKERLILQVLQDKKFQPIVATYTVLTPEGDVVGRMKKNYLFNFFRRKWDVYDPTGALVLIAREDSLLLSLLRRFLGPMLGLLRANFILVVPRAGLGEITRGEFNRNLTLFDRYVLDLSRDRPRMIDRRLAIALGVLLDTGESR
jgi:hypothetical protein